MIAQLRAEVLKVRSTRTTLGLVLAMVALTLLVVVLTGLLNSSAVLTDERQQRMLFAPSAIASIFAGLAGVLLMSSEYRYGTIRPTFLVMPRRATVLSAKLTAGLATGFVFGAVTFVVAVGVGSVILLARGVPYLVSAGDVAGLAAGELIGTALWGAFGVGLGAILRSQVGGVIALLAWDFVVNSLLLGLAPSVGRFMPTPATDALLGLHDAHLLTPVAGGAVLLGWTLVLAAAGLELTTRRDVA